MLSWPAWEALRAGPVYALDPEASQALAVRSAGIPVEPLAGTDDRSLAHAFRDLARGGRTAVWLAGPDGDPSFARALGDLVAREATGAELEVVYGSWDPPGARLLDVVAVMDRLRSPGGCPWDAEQTHASLAPYLLEEAYELHDAIEADDVELLREELGDVLLQVAFHARLAEELAEDERWSIDDVAGDLVAKLVRRHPHVFARAVGQRRRRGRGQLGRDQDRGEAARVGHRRRAARPAGAGAGRQAAPPGGEGRPGGRAADRGRRRRPPLRAGRRGARGRRGPGGGAAQHRPRLPRRGARRGGRPRRCR